MVIAIFEITNSLNYTCSFKEIFHIPNILQLMVLEMLFLNLEDPDIS